MNRSATLKEGILRRQAPHLAKLRGLDNPQRRPPRYYDREGKPITMAEWCVLLNSRAYSSLAWTKLTRHAFVSTVWLGLDHAFGRGPPIIFETMSFPSEHQARYATEAEAWAGHERITRFLLNQKRMDPRAFKANARRAHLARRMRR